MALAVLNDPAKPVHSYNPLVQIQSDKINSKRRRA